MDNTYLVFWIFCNQDQDQAIFGWDSLVFSDKHKLIAWLKEKKVGPDDICESIEEIWSFSKSNEYRSKYVILRNPEIIIPKITEVKISTDWEISDYHSDSRKERG